MFNPYSCRPIGSNRFEEHLLDVQASQYYATELPEGKTEDAWRLCEGSHAPWYREDPKEDPWTNLYWAIVISAFIDYLEHYEKKITTDPNKPSYWIYESRCISLENDFFRKSETLESYFDRLLIGVCWKGANDIEQCRKRLMREIGWLKRPNQKTKEAIEAAEWQKERKQKRAEERFRKLFAQMEERYSF